MAIGTALHYVGSALLFIAMLMLIVVDVSAPVVKQISFLDVNGGAARGAKFGVFGYCTTGTGGECSDAKIGYNPADILEGIISDADFSNIRSDSTEALTRVFVLHPVGTGLCFIAFLLSLVAHSTFLSLVATLVTGLSFIINAVAAIIDWVVFSLLRREVNRTSGSAKYSAASYLSIVAAALCLIATILMFVTCCAGRRRSRRQSRKVVADSY